MTENGAASLGTSGNACVNLFFKLTRDVSNNVYFKKWIDEAMCENPLTTMKILFHGRDCRGGKGDRHTFIRAMEYIYTNYRECWDLNIEHIPEYGRYLDWIEMYIHQPIIVEHIIRILKQDITNMENGQAVTLLAKWLPSEKKKWNLKTNILEDICKSLYNVRNVTTFHYKMLRVNYISPLRSYLKIVEKYMCEGKWDEIEFSKVPSIAMHRLKKAFERNAIEEFTAWKCSGARVNASQIDPHQLVRIYMSNRQYDEVIEAQWREIEANTISLKDTLVLSDVSGSMAGVPMEVSIALGILISSVAEEPFHNSIITFSENPTFHKIPNTCITLRDKVANVMNMQWGGNTNLFRVFNLILTRAKTFNLEADKMPKRLIILSDMQFDYASPNSTNFQVINDLYKNAGYTRPEIVFWNLRADTTSDFPVEFGENGVALISGYRTSILKAIISGKDFTPYNIMQAAINDTRYDRIRASAP
jgi:hypothetical protein